MKILFVSCFVNNSHYIELTKATLDKYLIDSEYTYICLNDAPTIKDENYIKIVSIISGLPDCYESILTESQKHNFIHISIPQNIHIKNRSNHSSARHTENLNWFNSNIDNLFPSYSHYDFLCYIDSDAFLSKPINLNLHLSNIDLAGPMIYINNHKKYPHTGLFFINLHTVKNFRELNWNDTEGTDTGSNISNFILNNPQYKILELGRYNGYRANNSIPNSHTIIKLDIPDIPDISDYYKLIDIWFNKSFLHFRAGSCFGVGSNLHRNNDRLFLYKTKYDAFLKLFH